MGRQLQGRGEAWRQGLFIVRVARDPSTSPYAVEGEGGMKDRWLATSKGLIERSGPLTLTLSRRERGLSSTMMRLWAWRCRG